MWAASHHYEHHHIIIIIIIIIIMWRPVTHPLNTDYRTWGVCFKYSAMLLYLYYQCRHYWLLIMINIVVMTIKSLTKQHDSVSVFLFLSSRTCCVQGPGTRVYIFVHCWLIQIFIISQHGRSFNKTEIILHTHVSSHVSFNFRFIKVSNLRKFQEKSGLG